MLQLSRINCPKVESSLLRKKEELKPLVQEIEFCKNSLVALNKFRYSKEAESDLSVDVPVASRERFMKQFPYMSLFLEQRRAFERAFELAGASLADLEEKVKELNGKIQVLEEEKDFLEEVILVLQEYEHLGKLKDNKLYESPASQVQIRFRFMSEFPYLTLFLGEQKVQEFCSKYDVFSLFGPFPGRDGEPQRKGYAGQKQDGLAPTVISRINKFYEEFKVEEEVKEESSIPVEVK
jgi:hypothetical protein